MRHLARQKDFVDAKLHFFYTLFMIFVYLISTMRGSDHGV
jgi:hypothetical protein